MIATFFIDRPIFAWVLSLVIILVGAVTVVFLPIDMYPPITPPTVQVTASYPGANAKVVADTVAAPIEEQVNGVDRMMYMSSQSTNDGSYTLTVTFEIGTDPNTAQVLVQNRVALAMPQLPPEVQLEGVSTLKTTPNILLAVNLISPHGKYDELYVSNYATIHIKDELARIKGVGSVNLFGQRQYSMRIWVDPDKLAARNLTAVDVVNSIQNQNVQVAAGAGGQEPAPPGQQFQLPLSALGQLDNVRQFGAIIIKAGQGATSQATASRSASAGQSTGASQATAATEAVSSDEQDSQSPSIFSTPIVHVRDVATVEMGAQSYDQIARLDGQPCTGLAIFQLPGSNALEVANAVKQRMCELEQDFPAGLKYEIIYDTTPFIRQSVDDVFRTLIEAILLVAFVVLLFLQDWKAMILPMIDVPVSLIGTFAVMAVLGFTLNNLTLFGLVLAIGIVVDDAIVVLENIERLIATGMDARSATIKAMQEITGPILAITLVLAAVFVPSIFIPGLTGQFYRQFAVTISTAMGISALNALTMTPSRAVSIFRTEQRGQHQDLKKEALPWWIFGVGGGFLTVWLGGRFLPGHFGVPSDQDSTSRWLYWTLKAATFPPGAFLGGLLGWYIIGPVNRALRWFFGGFNHFFERLTERYGRLVGKLLRVSAIVGAAYLCLLGLTAWRVSSAPKGFIPTQDQGYLLVNVQLPDSASVQRTDQIMGKIQEIAMSTPGVAHTVGVAGESFLLGTNGSNLGSMFVVLEPWESRSSGEYDAVIAEKIEEKCQKEIEGAVVGVFRAPPIRGLGNAGGFKLQTEQRGYVDLKRLQDDTDKLIDKANADAHFAGAFTVYRASTPQLYVDIDRSKAISLQVPILDVFTTLQVEMGGLYVNQISKFGRTWQVQVEAAPPFRAQAETVKRLQVRNTQAEMVPLGTLAHVDRVTGPGMVMRYNMYTSAAINGTPAPGASSGDVLTQMTRLANESGVKFEWTEMSYLENQEGQVGLLIFALGTVLVYLVLAAKYESWRLPLAVILVVPLCMLAAVTGMWIAHLPMDIFVQIGLLVLVGLACKNAILIVEYARQLRQGGADIDVAAIEASKIRFRPIIMTSLAFAFGVLPLVLARGAGAEMRQSLGVAVFAGMIGVTLFGIILTPVFFRMLLHLGGGRTPQREVP
jgi:multidrug efflux pump